MTRGAVRKHVLSSRGGRRIEQTVSHTQYPMGNSTLPVKSPFRASLGSRPLSEALTLGICHPARSCVIFLLLTCFVLFCFLQTSSGPTSSAPSLRDVHHEPVYPQPPFSCSTCFERTKGTRFLSLTAGSRMQRAGGGIPPQLHLEVEGGRWSTWPQLLFITSTCVMYCVVDFLWSPQPQGLPLAQRRSF